MPPDAKLMDELIRRIVNAVHPLRIVLFGSAAHAEMGPDSDLDVLVVMPDGTHRLKTAQYLYKQLFGFGVQIDILVATPGVLEQHKNNIGLIYRTVLAEGREIYAA